MQLFLTILAIILALIYLGRDFYKRFWGKKEQCDGCVIGKISEEKK